jgi:hypothetical protein
MKVTMLLADSAQVQGGKLYLLGGGWSVAGPEPIPMALAIKIDVPWDQANQQHKWAIALQTADGQPVIGQTPEGERPIIIDGQFEVGRPPGLVPGTPIDLPMAINLGPLPIAPGSRYVWRLEIDGYSEDDWFLAFTTRPARNGP